MAGPRVTTRASRPGRALVVLLLLIVALYGMMLLTRTFTPKLGLDLRGGTSVILTAEAQGGDVSSGQLSQAVSIIRQRVNAFGVSEADVVAQGNQNIVISLPGKGQQETAEKVGATALLYFRQVLAIGSPAPADATATPTPTPTTAPTGTPTGEPTGQPADEPAGTTTPAANGRVLSDALSAEQPAPAPEGDQPAPPAVPPTAPPTVPPEQPPQQGSAQGQVPPELQEAWDQLDCTDETARQVGSGDPEAPMIACDQDGAFKYALGPADVLGTDLDEANASLPQSGVGNWEVNLDFNGEGSTAFESQTRVLSQETAPRNQFAIVLDGQVVSAPSVDEPIPGGQARIFGDFTKQEAEDLANVLKYGALPLEFERSEVSEITPTLGNDQLIAGLVAGTIGLSLVVLYSLLYYRGLGLVAVFSLAAAALITYAVVVLLGPSIDFTLSLAGIAGLIIAIGITADSFIVFFERIRDEVRGGRSLRAAVEHGWVRARRTIIVSDVVSFLAAAILYVIAVGGVKGFAFTLGLTTLVDVVVVFLFSKPLVTALSRTKFFGDGHPLSGFDPRRLGARVRTEPAGATARRRAGLKEA